MGIDTLDFQGKSGRRQFVKFMQIAMEEEMEETEVRQERVDRGEGTYRIVLCGTVSLARKFTPIILTFLYYFPCYFDGVPCSHGCRSEDQKSIS